MQKPDYTTSLALVKAKQVMPETLLSKICSENPSAVGFAVREPKGIIVEKHTIADPAKHFEAMKRIMNGRKAYDSMFCFHSFPEEYDEDEIQPFVALRDSSKNPLLAVGIEGDFPRFASAEFSEAYQLMYEWLGPKIEAMYKTIGNSPQKLFDYLKTEQFRLDFAQVYGHRGVLTFMPSIGTLFTVEKNELGVSSPTWGEASLCYGYTEPVIEAATPAKVEKTKSDLGASKYATEDTPATPPTPTVVPPKDTPAPATDPVQKAADGIAELIDTFPPKELHGKALKTWYRSTTGGQLPGTDGFMMETNWRKRPAIKLRVTKHTQKEEDPKDMKDKAPPRIVTQNGNTAVVDVKGEVLPVVAGKVQQTGVEFLKKHLGDGSAVIDDPVKAQEDELKLATFTQLMAGSGVKSLDDIKRWRASFIASFVKQHPELAWLLVLQLRAERDELQQRLQNGDKTLGELAGTSVSTDTSTQTASTKPEPAKKAASGGSKYA